MLEVDSIGLDPCPWRLEVCYVLIRFSVLADLLLNPKGPCTGMVKAWGLKGFPYSYLEAFVCTYLDTLGNLRARLSC